MVFISANFPQVGPRDRLSNRIDSVNDLLNLKKHSPESLLEDLDIPDLAQIVPDKEEEVPETRKSPTPACSCHSKTPSLRCPHSLIDQNKGKSVAQLEEDQTEQEAEDLLKLDLKPSNLEPPRQAGTLELA